MTNMYLQLSKITKRFARDEQGVVALIFALLFPITVLMMWSDFQLEQFNRYLNRTSQAQAVALQRGRNEGADSRIAFTESVVKTNTKLVSGLTVPDGEANNEASVTVEPGYLTISTNLEDSMPIFSWANGNRFNSFMKIRLEIEDLDYCKRAMNKLKDLPWDQLYNVAVQNNVYPTILKYCSRKSRDYLRGIDNKLRTTADQLALINIGRAFFESENGMTKDRAKTYRGINPNLDGSTESIVYNYVDYDEGVGDIRSGIYNGKEYQQDFRKSNGKYEKNDDGEYVSYAKGKYIKLADLGYHKDENVLVRSQDAEGNEIEEYKLITQANLAENLEKIVRFQWIPYFVNNKYDGAANDTRTPHAILWMQGVYNQGIPNYGATVPGYKDADVALDTNPVNIKRVNTWGSEALENLFTLNEYKYTDVVLEKEDIISNYKCFDKTRRYFFSDWMISDDNLYNDQRVNTAESEVGTPRPFITLDQWACDSTNQCTLKDTDHYYNWISFDRTIRVSFFTTRNCDSNTIQLVRVRVNRGNSVNGKEENPYGIKDTSRLGRHMHELDVVVSKQFGMKADPREFQTGSDWAPDNNIKTVRVSKSLSQLVYGRVYNPEKGTVESNSWDDWHSGRENSYVYDAGANEYVAATPPAGVKYSAIGAAIYSDTVRQKLGLQTIFDQYITETTYTGSGSRKDYFVYLVETIQKAHGINLGITILPEGWQDDARWGNNGKPPP